MKSFLRKHLGPILVSAAVLLATPALPAFAQDHPTARVALEVDAFTLDPRVQRDNTAFRLTDIIYSGLVVLDKDLLPHPDLATSWDNPDPTTYIFHLRPDAMFQDGTPVTADDVVFTFTSVQDPALKSRYAQFFSPVKTIEAVDAHTVKFTLSAPYGALLSYLDLGIVPKHYVEAGGDLGNKPIGSGPYKLDSWEKGVSIDLSAFDKYYGGTPYTPKIHIPIVTDFAARAQALEAGDIDILMSNLNPQDINRLAANTAFTHVAMPGVTFNYLNINTADPILSDPAVRKAVAMLVDAKTINDQILGGIDTLANGIVLPAFPWAYSTDVQQPPFDIEKAKAALDAAGWKAGADGIRMKDGKKLSIKISTNTGIRGQIVEYMQNVFQQAGIDATTDIADYATFIGKVYTGDYGIAMLSMNNIADPDRSIYLQLHTGAPLNWGKYSNPDLDKAAEEARTGTTPEARGAAYKTAATIIATEVPYYILTYVRQDTFTDKAFSWFVPEVRGYLRSLAAGPAK